MKGEPRPLLHAVILAGGSGTRFWPLSREMSPKQLLDIFGGASLMTRAVRRILPWSGAEQVHVVTGERLLNELRNHLMSQQELQHVRIDYLVEPEARNTAPAIALAAAALAAVDQDSVMAVLPSDHLLEDGEVWADTVQVALRMAEAGRVVTLGLQPTGPETGYGYIQTGDVLPGFEAGQARGREVVAFHEKPDRPTAERFVAAGGYLWNSGMVVAKASVLLEELKKAGDEAKTPDSEGGRAIAETAEWFASLPAEEWLSDEARERYRALPSVPFDKAVLEVSGRVACVPTDMDWSDVGSLLSIEKLGEPDPSGNVLIGRAFDVGSKQVISYSQDRLVATLGLKDVVVVDTSDATLVVAKERVQDVRLVVEALRQAGAPEVVASRSSIRPWGSWTLLMKGEGFQIKTIDVKPGQRLSLQSHRRRSEHWIVINGQARVQRDEDILTIRPNESVYLPTGCVHRLENVGDEDLKVIEVAVGSYLGEDDIVRFEDDWGR